MTIDTRKFRYVAALLLAVVVAAGAYAFTASNSVDASHAGSGTGNITGYAVTNIKYTLDSTDASKLSAVSFDLDAAAGTVKAQVVTGGTWYDCTNSSGFSWTCSISPSTDVQPTDKLSVVATD